MQQPEMATDTQSTTQPVIIEDQRTPGNPHPSRALIVVLKDDYSLDEHFKWLLDALGMEKSKYKRLNREAVGDKINMCYWVRGPPIAYRAYFDATIRRSDYSLVCHAPGVARVIKIDSDEFLEAYRQPLLVEWSFSGAPKPGWTVQFDDQEYTTTQHFEAIGRKIPFPEGPKSLKVRIKQRFDPEAERKWIYYTAGSVTEEEIKAVFADPHVLRVSQVGVNNTRFTGETEAGNAAIVQETKENVL